MVDHPQTEQVGDGKTEESRQDGFTDLVLWRLVGLESLRSDPITGAISYTRVSIWYKDRSQGEGEGRTGRGEEGESAHR